MRVKKRIAAILFLIVALVFLGYLGYGRYIKETRLHVLEAGGTIEATQVELRAKVAGTLRGLAISAGDPVARDQVVAEIVRNDLVAQKERDALSVVRAQAQLNDLIAGAREQEIKEAQIAVDIAQLNYDQAVQTFHRATALYQEQAIPEAELEGAETACKQSRNALASAENRLSLLAAGSRPEQIEAARAELERNIAVLTASEALFADTKITCPINGTVLSRNFEDGEVIQIGSSVASIANLNDMWIKVYIPTADLPRIKLGQQVRFTVSGSVAEYQGVIVEIASQGEYTPKTIQTKTERANIVYAVKIKIDNENNVLKPGMPADVVLE